MQLHRILKERIGFRIVERKEALAKIERIWVPESSLANGLYVLVTDSTCLAAGELEMR